MAIRTTTEAATTARVIIDRAEGRCGAKETPCSRPLSRKVLAASHRDRGKRSPPWIAGRGTSLRAASAREDHDLGAIK
jgi:hypothetical protein